MNKFIYFIIILISFSCHSQEETVVNKQNGLSKENATPNVYNCRLIEKDFVNKIGASSGIKELYLRCSIQDYYIKLCESNITKEDLLPYLKKGISVKGEVKEGLWDDCNQGSEPLQSRVGNYIVIYSIEK